MTLRVGIWLMPNNRSKGELESFLADLIAERDRLWRVCDTFVASVPQCLLQVKRTKATLRVWLVLKGRPLLLGRAIETNLIHANRQAGRDFVNWLSELFQFE